MQYEFEYARAYDAKKENEGVYIINDFCSQIDGNVGIEYVPYLLRLYCDKAVTCEQNEFITIVLSNVFNKSPQACTKAIVENILILKEEDAEECISELLLILVWWNEYNIDCLVDILNQSDQEKKDYFVELVKNAIEDGLDTDKELEKIVMCIKS